MYAENLFGRPSDFRAYLAGVKLLYRDPSDQPSIQLAIWAEATLPPGDYRVRFRDQDQQFEITGGGVLVAIWPTPGVLGEAVGRAAEAGVVDVVGVAPGLALISGEDC